MYYFAHLNNLNSIITNGILPRNKILKKKFSKFTDFSNDEVQKRRQYRKIYLNGKETNFKLHDFVPLYWVTSTPTLHAVKNIQRNLFFIEIDFSIELSGKIILYTDGNAANIKTKFYDNYETAKEYIPFDVIDSKYWTKFEDGARKRNSEILIYNSIEPIYFKNIIVNNKSTYNYVGSILDKLDWIGLDENFELQLNPEYFF